MFYLVFLRNSLGFNVIFIVHNDPYARNISNIDKFIPILFILFSTNPIKYWVLRHYTLNIYMNNNTFGF